MRLHELGRPEGSRKARKRKGRGQGSGQGTTAGRGSKGLKSRSGGSVRPGFEGGQMPLHRRLPKRGFTNVFAKKTVVVNLRDLERFEAGIVVDVAALVKAGLVKGRFDAVKVLAQGEITRPLTIKVDKWSDAAHEKVERAGGRIEGR